MMETYRNCAGEPWKTIGGEVSQIKSYTWLELTDLQDEKSTSGNEDQEDKSASEEDLIVIESDPDREWEPEWQYRKPS